MMREEEIIKTAKEYYNPKNGSPFSLQMRVGFITGAKWADEHPISNSKELLYVAQKTAEITKKEIINKACEWLENNAENFTIDGGLSIECLIHSFKKAMRE